jgi:chaperonin cofactor prefoldin
LFSLFCGHKGNCIIALLDGRISRIPGGGALRQRVDTFEKYVDQRFDGFEKRIEERFKAVNQRFDNVDQRFEYLDKRIDILEHSWNQSLDIRERLAALEERLKKR